MGWVSQATKISWKSDAVNLSKLHPDTVEDDEIVEPGSFFNYFEREGDFYEVCLL